MKTIKVKTGLLVLLILMAWIHTLIAQGDTSPEIPPERIYSYQERELEYLMTIWPGEYDNVEQMDFDRYLKKDTPKKGKHVRSHSFAKRLDLPAFGNYVIYIEEYENDNPDIITKQGIYELFADEEANAIRVKVHHFKKPIPKLSVMDNLSFLKDIKPNSALLKKGCDMLMERDGMSFRGKTENTNCINSSSNSQLSIDYQIMVGENEYWFNEIKYHKVTGNRLPDQEQSTWSKLEKARCFVCMIDFPNKENGRPTITKYYIPIHDQGGKFEFDYDDGRHMVLGMRNTWSLGMQRETFVIFIQEGSQKGKTLIYSWGNPGADRIGFNPGWIRVQCDLDTPENRKLQYGLRPGS
ncbi:CpcT/CpeT family chromophore lyase [uncultured Croceitalea sp.]|uniref:CpcT/CpeT family chromophore lyase n=1 Tax=uncultured Croceitalea sp. TaxID=1798908 RepID=UPI0033068F86